MSPATPNTISFVTTLMKASPPRKGSAHTNGNTCHVLTKLTTLIDPSGNRVTLKAGTEAVGFRLKGRWDEVLMAFYTNPPENRDQVYKIMGDGTLRTINCKSRRDPGRRQARSSNLGN